MARRYTKVPYCLANGVRFSSILRMALVCVRPFPSFYGFAATGRHANGASTVSCASATASSGQYLQLQTFQPFIKGFLRYPNSVSYADDPELFSLTSWYAVVRPILSMAAICSTVYVRGSGSGFFSLLSIVTSIFYALLN